MTHHSEPAREAVARIANELREHTAFRFKGDCKCGNCQLVPRELIDKAALALDRLSASPAPAASGGLEPVREDASLIERLHLLAAHYINQLPETAKTMNHAADRIAALAAPAATGGETITARYTNWRGETTERTFIPHRVFFGSNEWHPEPQILIEATDCDKGALRTFAAAGFTHPAPSTGASAGVKVRALDWSPDGVIAETPFGAYSVGQTYDDKWTWTRTEYPYGFPSDPLPTEAEAKAAAQADFETRIRAALEGRSDG